MSVATTFQSELMLAGWSETHNGGAKITFWLPDATDLDAFRALTVRKGNTAGQRFMAVLVQIGDDELPVPADPAPPAAPKERTGPLCMLAVRFCQDPVFYEWASEHFGYSIVGDHQAKEVICTVANVDSRVLLDRSDFAAKAFHEQIRKPYVAWRQTKGIK